jgi:hypothetical protein
MSWLIAVLASLALAEPLVTAGSCRLDGSGPMSLNLAAPLEVFETNVGDVSVPARSGGTVVMADADLESYLRLHSGFARGTTRSLLMPWSDMGTLARSFQGPAEQDETGISIRGRATRAETMR